MTRIMRREQSKRWRALRCFLLAGLLALWTVQGAWAQAPPTIRIAPNTAALSTTEVRETVVPAIITGTDLTGASVRVQGRGVTARVQLGGTATSLPVHLVIGRDALVGQVNIIVTTRGGTAVAPFFLERAVGEPTITSLRPNTGTVSATRRVTVDAVITGTNLAGATVSMPDEGGVSATVQPGGTSTRLPIRVVIEPGAYAGNRTIKVTTPTGRAHASFNVELPAEVAQGVPPGAVSVQLSRFRPDPTVCAGFPVHFSASVNVSESLRQSAANLRRYGGVSYLAYRLLFDGQTPERSDQVFAEIAAGMNSTYPLFTGGVARSFSAGSHTARMEVHQVNQPGQSATGPALASGDMAVSVLDCRHQITAFSTSPAQIREGQELEVRVGVRNAASYTIYVGREAGARSLQLHARAISPSEWVGEITETVRIPYRELRNVLSGGTPGGTVHLTLRAYHLYLGTTPELQPVTRGSQVTLLAPPPPPAHPLAGRWSGTIRSYRSDNQQLCYEGGANLTVNADGSGTLVAGHNDPNKDVSQRYATIPFTRLDGGGDTYRLSPPAPRPIILTHVVVGRSTLNFGSEWPYGIDCWEWYRDWGSGLEVIAGPVVPKTRSIHHRVEFILFR